MEAKTFLFASGPLHGVIRAVQNPALGLRIALLSHVDWYQWFKDFPNGPSHNIDLTVDYMEYRPAYVDTGKRMIVIMTPGGDELRLDVVLDAMAVAIYFPESVR